MNSEILVIEDSLEIRENIAELLSLAGYIVDTAPNGKVGLERARKHSPDLILCDIMMPELDGYGVLRAINNIPDLQEVPFVFLTAKSERADFRNAMDLGADDYLTKPFTGDELLRVVEARLKKKRHRKDSTAQINGSSSESRNVIKSMSELVKRSANRMIKKLHAKDTIYLEGDTAVGVYVVLSGKVKLYKTNDSGKDYITEIVNEGDAFGLQSLINEREQTHSAMAIENAEVALIPRQEFLALVNSNPELTMQVMKILSDNMSGYEEKLINLAYGSARKRVADALLFICKQYCKDEANSGVFPVSRENLSAIAGISPESVSRNLSDFRDEKLIVTENAGIRILDIRKLASLKN